MCDPDLKWWLLWFSDVPSEVIRSLNYSSKLVFGPLGLLIDDKIAPGNGLGKAIGTLHSILSLPLMYLFAVTIRRKLKI